MSDFFFDDEATETLRYDLMLTIQMLDTELADAFEPLLLVLVEAIEARPPNMRKAAVDTAKEMLSEAFADDPGDVP